MCQIVWRKLPDPNPLTIGLDTWVEDTRLHVEHVHKRNQWNLIIEHVTSADQGDYECQVSMKERSLRKNIQLEVIGERAEGGGRGVLVGVRV